MDFFFCHTKILAGSVRSRRNNLPRGLRTLQGTPTTSHLFEGQLQGLFFAVLGAAGAELQRPRHRQPPQPLSLNLELPDLYPNFALSNIHPPNYAIVARQPTTQGSIAYILVFDPQDLRLYFSCASLTVSIAKYGRLWKRSQAKQQRQACAAG